MYKRKEILKDYLFHYYRATVWTLAQDRRIIRCEIKSTGFEITYNVPTQGGYTYCIAASPLDTSRVAFGVGDAMLRLWNLCEPHENTFDITMLWQKIKGKVMAVSSVGYTSNRIIFSLNFSSLINCVINFRFRGILRRRIYSPLVREKAALVCSIRIPQNLRFYTDSITDTRSTLSAGVQSRMGKPASSFTHVEMGNWFIMIQRNRIKVIDKKFPIESHPSNR